MTTVTLSRKRFARGMVWVATIAIVAASVEAWGQTASGVNWHRGTTLAGFAGAASPDTKAALGTALGWDIVPHLTVEGRGVWLVDNPGTTDFVAWLGALVPVRPGAALVPFASAGVGMYRATVQAGEGDDFYQQRLGSRERATFQDFALGFGGGADFFVTPHFAIRPELTVLVTMSGADTRTTALYGVHMAYHFESHKTP